MEAILGVVDTVSATWRATLVGASETGWDGTTAASRSTSPVSCWTSAREGLGQLGVVNPRGRGTPPGERTVAR